MDRSAHQDQQRRSALVLDPVAKAAPITELAQDIVPRVPTTIAELDRVLGGSNGDQGIVPGSVVLLGGDPGIGKSTLMLQAADGLASTGEPVLYVSSEESVQQTQLRARRLGAASENLFVLADTNLARILDQVRTVKPAVLVVDSIQMAYKGDLDAGPGSVAQLRACCSELVYLSKASGVATFLVGHVTKEGRLAGPRLLEHMVDTVLYFEGDRYHSHRIVRATKNRFGTTLEVGLFQMTERGLSQVSDSSSLLTAEYRTMSGSVICPVVHGSRCMLAELQALTVTGILGAVKRKVSGLDPHRLAMLIAVLEKRGGLRLADQDVFASSAGGVKIAEPAADLAIALAIAGAHYNRGLEPGTSAIGEIGLGGEVRAVQQVEQRYAEAARMGFTQIVGPPSVTKPPAGCELLTVKKVDEALQLLS